MIKINNLNYSYSNKKVLDGLFLDIKANQKVSIIGKSGCGKTTLLKIIMGINLDYSGEVLVYQKPVTKINEQVSIVFQKNGLFEFMSVYDNLKLTKKSDQIIFEIASKLRIEDLLSEYPKQLSGGQLQRANIARALISNKPFMLLDEPTSSLDEFSKEEFHSQVITSLNNNKFGYIIVTHDIKEALVMSERIIVLESGKVKKEFISPFYGDTKSYLKPQFNDLYLEIKKEFYE